MRLRGVEPPRSCLHTDLNRARLPVPPQPREQAIYLVGAKGPPARRDSPASPAAKMPAPLPLSSRGLGRRILSPETGVRIPVAVLHESPANAGFFLCLGRFEVTARVPENVPKSC